MPAQTLLIEASENEEKQRNRRRGIALYISASTKAWIGNEKRALVSNFRGLKYLH